MYPIITISREFGSGGHSIGEKVAQELGIPFYDSMIVEQVAESSGFDKEFITHMGEYTSSLSRWFGNGNYPMGYISTPQDEIYKIQRQVILELAAKGPCVIVGRCADYILETEGIPSFNIFIHSDYEHRAARILEKYGDTGEPIRKRLDKKDKGRKAYYRYYTERNWGDYKNYHLNLDSGYLGEEACKDLIVAIAKRRVGES